MEATSTKQQEKQGCYIFLQSLAFMTNEAMQELITPIGHC
jgi:hypothetical protein